MEGSSHMIWVPTQKKLGSWDPGFRRTISQNHRQGFTSGMEACPTFKSILAVPDARMLARPGHEY